ncbi:hypothetical protein ACFZDK_34805 [Streptomyces sp. NPDC007901]|uniref:SLAC1 family transporter n=1 Tax=Streptomyces sp. NPDC007901 TaxID=3364785 RepID=UPI0036EF1EC4
MGPLSEDTIIRPATPRPCPCRVSYVSLRDDAVFRCVDRGVGIRRLTRVQRSPAVSSCPHMRPQHAPTRTSGHPAGTRQRVCTVLVPATALTVREIRRGLPFAPTWWSFIFPLGACVTGTSALAARTGSRLFVWIAVVLYALLLAAWAVVAWYSLRHAFRQRERAPR